MKMLHEMLHDGDDEDETALMVYFFRDKGRLILIVGWLDEWMDGWDDGTSE